MEHAIFLDDILSIGSDVAVISMTNSYLHMHLVTCEWKMSCYFLEFEFVY